jgi:transposase
MREKRRQFTREFKTEAIRLLSEGGKELGEVARDLGVRRDTLSNWKRQAEGRAGLSAEDVFPGHGKRTTQDEEIRRLRTELEVARQEVAFLKKAAAYFARESRPSTP